MFKVKNSDSNQVQNWINLNPGSTITLRNSLLNLSPNLPQLYQIFQVQLQQHPRSTTTCPDQQLHQIFHLPTAPDNLRLTTAPNDSRSTTAPNLQTRITITTIISLPRSQNLLCSICLRVICRSLDVVISFQTFDKFLLAHTDFRENNNSLPLKTSIMIWFFKIKWNLLFQGTPGHVHNLHGIRQQHDACDLGKHSALC